MLSGADGRRDDAAIRAAASSAAPSDGSQASPRGATRTTRANAAGWAPHRCCAGPRHEDVGLGPGERRVARGTAAAPRSPRHVRDGSGEAIASASLGREEGQAVKLARLMSVLSIGSRGSFPARGDRRPARMRLGRPGVLEALQAAGNTVQPRGNGCKCLRRRKRPARGCAGAIRQGISGGRRTRDVAEVAGRSPRSPPLSKESVEEPTAPSGQGYGATLTERFLE